MYVAGSNCERLVSHGKSRGYSGHSWVIFLCGFSMIRLKFCMENFVGAVIV